jgi:hypothetical protein
MKMMMKKANNEMTMRGDDEGMERGNDEGRR